MTILLKPPILPQPLNLPILHVLNAEQSAPIPQ